MFHKIAPKAIHADRWMVLRGWRFQTIFLSDGDALKRTVLPALTLIGSPVRGFTPLRALVLRTVKVPKVGRVNLPSFFNSLTIASIRSVAARVAATPVISVEPRITDAMNALALMALAVDIGYEGLV
jgi:hypothetical protein